MFPALIRLVDGDGVRYRVVADLVAERQLVLEPVAGGPRRTVTYREVLEGVYVPEVGDVDLVE